VAHFRICHGLITGGRYAVPVHISLFHWARSFFYPAHACMHAADACDTWRRQEKPCMFLRDSGS
jgi:hypothetical protein